MIRTIVYLNLVIYTYSQPCPNDCNNRGRCVNPGQTCECFDRFSGPDCSLYKCPHGIAWFDAAIAIDTAHNLAECSNRGTCDPYTGTCTCYDGFEGAACERNSCPSQCNSNGICLSMRSYAMTKDQGFMPQGVPVYTYESIWDAESIYGCKCDTHYEGPDCSLRKCARGDDPMTGNSVSTASNPTQVNTIQRVNCRGSFGTFTLSYGGYTTKRIPFDASAVIITEKLEALPSIGVGGVLVTLYGLQACLPSGQSYFQVEFLQNFGTLPLLIPDYRLLGSDALMVVNNFQIGTKENSLCSNRGLCDTTSGICSCSTGFSTSDGYAGAGTRGDCGYYNLNIPLQTCPGSSTPCSGNGICSGSPTFVCQCSDEWTGADCSLRTCPKDISWFGYPSADNIAHLYDLVECSNMGICDRTNGICTCMKNFQGAACEQLSCPGSLVTATCNGQGQCIDMSTLATYATINGNLADYTYGLLPNNPNTWDAKKVLGCFCDPGYTGYDCSLMTCPYGNDPALMNLKDATQVITCTDATLVGSIRFTFRQETTITLPATATSAQVQKALNSLTTINRVLVNPINGKPDSLCSILGSEFEIIFLQAHGDVPLLISTLINIDSLTITTATIGTTKNLECSGRGICDRSRGVCNCFSGYGSSDGQGEAGNIGDCGHILPYQQ